MKLSEVLHCTHKGQGIQSVLSDTSGTFGGQKAGDYLKVEELCWALSLRLLHFNRIQVPVLISRKMT